MLDGRLKMEGQPTSKALILHSGGLDSTVCLLLAIEQGRDVTSLGVDYGQRHRVELEYARLASPVEIEKRAQKIGLAQPQNQSPNIRRPANAEAKPKR